MAKFDVEKAPPVDDVIDELKAKRDAARAEVKAARRAKADLPETDEDGIKFLQHRKQANPVLCGVIGKLMKYPLWANGLVRDGDGTVRPKIVMVPVSEQHSNGQLVEIYKRKKGFKEVSEIPDKYAEFRDPYVKAIAEWRATMQKREALRRQLEDAGLAPKRGGITGVGSMAGLTGGR